MKEIKIMNISLKVNQKREKQIEELTKKQKRFDALIQSLIDSGQVKPLSES